MQSPMSEKVLRTHARCHCNLNNFELSVPESSLPLPASICHCWKCRHLSGTIFTSYATLPPSALPFDSSSVPESLKSYETSKEVPEKSILRYFCETCGAHVFSRTAIEGQVVKWQVATGILSQTEGFIVYTHHQHVADAPPELKDILDDDLPRYGLNAPTDPNPPISTAHVTLALPPADVCRTNRPVSASSSVCNPNSEEDSDPESDTDVLHARCHCSSISFLISRPSRFPSHLGLNKWCSPDQQRWKSTHCLCNSCRLNSGFPLMSWAFVPRRHVRFLPPTMTSLSGYQSRDDVWRQFCGTCGATVFFEISGRENVFDIAIGVLDFTAEPGKRLEEWLWWGSEISYAEDAQEGDVVKGEDGGALGEKVVEGYRKYLVEHGLNTYDMASHGTGFHVAIN